MQARIQSAGMYGLPQVARNELEEIALFNKFLTTHVRRNRIKSVQRALLWSEWVRFHLKQTNTFPGHIFENEFDDIMTGKLNVNVVTEDFFGPMYDGIQFISGESSKKK
jgi:hypothetical protein